MRQTPVRMLSSPPSHKLVRVEEPGQFLHPHHRPGARPADDVGVDEVDPPLLTAFTASQPSRWARIPPARARSSRGL